MQPTALVPTRAPAVVMVPQAPAVVQQLAAPQPVIVQPAAPAPVEATPAPLVPIEPMPAPGINASVHVGSDGVSVGGSISNAAPDKEATVQAWLSSPPSVPTATAIPTEQVPAFKASFQDAPPCNPFVGYVGDKARQCYH